MRVSTLHRRFYISILSDYLLPRHFLVTPFARYAIFCSTVFCCAIFCFTIFLYAVLCSTVLRAATPPSIKKTKLFLLRTDILKACGAVAQSGERRSLKPQCAGSSPVCSTRSFLITGITFVHRLVETTESNVYDKNSPARPSPSMDWKCQA